MANVLIDELKKRAEQVRDETASGANTAARIGGLLLDMVDTLNNITDLGFISSLSALDDKTTVGIYKYSYTLSAGSAVGGMLFALASVDDPSGTTVLRQYRMESSGMYERKGTVKDSSVTWGEWAEAGGAPSDMVSAEKSNQVGNAFALTSRDKDGDISVSAGRNASVRGSGKAQLQGGTAEVKATNGSATVQASQSVNVEATEGDINLNPGTQGKVKAGGKEVATTDKIPQYIGKGVAQSDSDLDLIEAPGIYEMTYYTGKDEVSGIEDFEKKYLIVSTALDSGYAARVTQFRFDGEGIRARSKNAIGGTWSAWSEIGGSSVSVVQSTGSSTTAVMSQKAVTDELAKKAGTDTATTSADGLMSKEDKTKLNTLSTIVSSGAVYHLSTPQAFYEHFRDLQMFPQEFLNEFQALSITPEYLNELLLQFQVPLVYTIYYDGYNHYCANGDPSDPDLISIYGEYLSRGDVPTYPFKQGRVEVEVLFPPLSGGQPYESVFFQLRFKPAYYGDITNNSQFNYGEEQLISDSGMQSNDSYVEEVCLLKVGYDALMYGTSHSKVIEYIDA